MTKSVAIFIFPHGQSLDISGPMEVFSLANTQHRDETQSDEPLYELHYLAETLAPVRMASNLVIQPDLSLQCSMTSCHTLLISGGMDPGPEQVRGSTKLINALKQRALSAQRIGSVCSGALILAATGLLDGRKATTHWSDAYRLGKLHPQVTVIPDAIYVRDGQFWTSAGVTAGMDMALAMVAQDHGMPLALKVAKRMVMITKRSGGQTQFSDQLQAQNSPDAFLDLIHWLRENLHLEIDVQMMAQRVNMSERNFRRRFAAVFQHSPQKYLTRLRIESAKALLENTDKELKRIASECGFRSEDTLRRAFLRQLGVRPLDYRRQFGVLN